MARELFYSGCTLFSHVAESCNFRLVSFEIYSLALSVLCAPHCVFSALSCRKHSTSFNAVRALNTIGSANKYTDAETVFDTPGSGVRKRFTRTCTYLRRYIRRDTLHLSGAAGGIVLDRFSSLCIHLARRISRRSAGGVKIMISQIA